MEKIFISVEFSDLTDGFEVCKNCGHTGEWHEWDDYEGDTCTHENCDCYDFEMLFDKNGYAIYDFKDSTSEGKLPKEIVEKHQRK